MIRADAIGLWLLNVQCMYTASAQVIDDATTCRMYAYQGAQELVYCIAI